MWHNYCMVEIDIDTKKNTDKRLKRRNKLHHYAPGLLVVLGVVANAAAVADLFTKHIGAIGVVAGTLTVIVGLYLLLGSWGKRVGWTTVLAVAIIVAGSVTLSLILQKGGYIDTGDTGTSTKKEEKDDHPTDDDPVEEITDKGTYYKLAVNEALDLDDGNETILVQQSSAKPPSDLYFNDWGYISPSIGSFYPYQAPRDKTGNAAKDEYNSCRNLIDTSELGLQVFSSSSIKPGKSYCAETTKGAVMLVTMEELIDKGMGSDKSTVSFYAKVLEG